jgi:hypothetical protein
MVSAGEKGGQRRGRAKEEPGRGGRRGESERERDGDGGKREMGRWGERRGREGRGKREDGEREARKALWRGTGGCDGSHSTHACHTQPANGSAAQCTRRGFSSKCRWLQIHTKGLPTRIPSDPLFRESSFTSASSCAWFSAARCSGHRHAPRRSTRLGHAHPTQQPPPAAAAAQQQRRRRVSRCQVTCSGPLFCISQGASRAFPLPRWACTPHVPCSVARPSIERPLSLSLPRRVAAACIHRDKHRAHAARTEYYIPCISRCWCVRRCRRRSLSLVHRPRLRPSGRPVARSPSARPPLLSPSLLLRHCSATPVISQSRTRVLRSPLCFSSLQQQQWQQARRVWPISCRAPAESPARGTYILPVSILPFRFYLQPPPHCNSALALGRSRSASPAAFFLSIFPLCAQSAPPALQLRSHPLALEFALACTSSFSSTSSSSSSSSCCTAPASSLLPLRFLLIHARESCARRQSVARSS